MTKSCPHAIFSMTAQEVREHRPDDELRQARIAGNTLVITSRNERRRVRRSELPGAGPRLSSGHAISDWAFLIARRDIESNFYPGGLYAGEAFRAPSSVSWVRDTSYAVLQGLAVFYPQKAAEVLRSLLRNKEGDIQPEQFANVWEERFYTMTDNLLWVIAAEKLTRVTGDDALLRRGAPHALRTLNRMLDKRFDSRSFLFIGGSTFFDGHNGYPFGLTGLALKSISTNLIALRAMKILANLNMVPAGIQKKLTSFSDQLRQAVNRELWLERRGFYAQFQHGTNYREERLEAAGNLLAVADPDTPLAQAQRILKALPLEPFGLPAIHPPYCHRIVYHTGAVWPFTLGLTLWAINERSLKQSALVTQMATDILRTGVLEGNFMELVESATGRGIYSEKQVWSAAAMLAVVEHAIFGMHFETGRLIFRPQIPAFLHHRFIRITKVPLRGGYVTMSVSPSGQVSVDGHRLKDNILPLPGPVRRRAASETSFRDILFTVPFWKSTTHGHSMKTSCGGVSTELSPRVQMVFPAEEQIGSYAFVLTVRNMSTRHWSMLFSFRVEGRGLQVTPRKLRLALAAGEEQTHQLRVGFDEPPVWFSRGRLIVTSRKPVLTLTADLRRLFTLDSEWRIKPMYLNASHNFSRNFNAFKSQAFLRAPMHGEVRLGPYHGVLWYARRLAISTEWAGRALIFYCAGMSDRDITWFNGNEIGQTGDPSNPAVGRPRKYRVPADIVKPGVMNTMVIKTWSSGKDIGLCRGPLLLAPEDEFAWALATVRRLELETRGA